MLVRAKAMANGLQVSEMYDNSMRHARLVRTQLLETRDDLEQQQMIVQGLAGEQLGGDRMVARVQNFGFASSPPIGSHGFAMQMNGARGMATLLGMEHADHRQRNLNYGETAIYDAHGNVISLVQKKIRIVSADSIELVAPEIALNGNCTIGGTFGEGKPAALQGTTDTADHACVGNLASKVNVV
jgi:phage gp45-like